MDRAPINLDEFERLRRLVPERPDFHLHNWSIWRRGDQIAEGYADHSTCLETMGGCAALESSDHLYERQMGGWAETADNVLNGMTLQHRFVISHVYESAVYHFRGSIDDLLVEAAEEFWRRASRWLV